MLNIEKYKNEIINARYTNLTCSVHDRLLQLSNISCTGNCIECKKNVMEWLLSEYKEPILNDTEREYLSAVIKPFRNRVNYITKEDYITKEETFDSPMEFIHIDLFDGDIADFPNFKANTMYKGMELDKSYTLQELGL